MNKSIKVYVINLSRASDRRRHMTEELKKIKIPYEFVEAVSSTDLMDDQIKITNENKSYFKDLKPAEIACSLSHIKALNKGVMDNVDIIVVMEDDVIISKWFTQLIFDLSKMLKDNEVTTLGNLVFKPIELFLDEIINSDFSFYRANSYENLFGSQGYCLTGCAARCLSEFLLPVKSIADDWNRVINESPIKRIRVVIPFPIQHAEFISTINMGTDNEFSIRSRLKNFFYKNKIFPIYNLFLYFRRKEAAARHFRNIVIDGKRIKKLHKI